MYQKEFGYWLWRLRVIWTQYSAVGFNTGTNGGDIWQLIIMTYLLAYQILLILIIWLLFLKITGIEWWLYAAHWLNCFYLSYVSTAPTAPSTTFPKVTRPTAISLRMTRPSQPGEGVMGEDWRELDQVGGQAGGNATLINVGDSGQSVRLARYEARYSGGWGQTSILE